MKLLSTVLAALMLVFLSSAAGTDRSEAAPGSQAPIIEMSNASGNVNLSALRGKYVIINFWSSANPQSRINNALYDRSFGRGQHPEVKCISVCTDDSRALFNQIMRLDSLNADSQFYYEDARVGALLQQYNPAGNVAYLVDPQGKVLALNPDVQTVLSMARI